jgi:23S rRNA (pseudouridine1915-N3)-methyltransferase
MRVTICAVGRMKPGPERTLLDDYLARFDRVGRGLGLGPASVIEVEGRKSGRAAEARLAEARLIEAALPRGAYILALDERGRTLGSETFAGQLERLAASGTRDLACMIGGADGLDPSLRERADLSLSLGPMVWPHMLVRVMLAEQLYRAASILAGTPYHRGG